MPSSKSPDKEDLQEDEEGRRRECCDIFVLKIVLYLFNFLFLLSGVAILGIGLWTVIHKHSYVAVLATSLYQATSYVLILIGIVIIIVVFGLGCLGTWRENQTILIIYAVLLIIIFLLEAICGILAYFYEARVHDELVENLKETMMTNYRRDIAITQSIDDMQLKFKCCGAGSFEDWINSDIRVPDSCCKSPSNGCADKSRHPSNIYYEGCVDRLAESIRPHLIILGAIGLGLCFLQILGVILSCWLIKKIKDRDEIERNRWR